MIRELKIVSLLAQFKDLDINQQIDYDKSYLYSLIIHSTVVEGFIRIEKQLLFDRHVRNIKK